MRGFTTACAIVGSRSQADTSRSSGLKRYIRLQGRRTGVPQGCFIADAVKKWAVITCEKSLPLDPDFDALLDSGAIKRRLARSISFSAWAGSEEAKPGTRTALRPHVRSLSRCGVYRPIAVHWSLPASTQGRMLGHSVAREPISRAVA